MNTHRSACDDGHFSCHVVSGTIDFGHYDERRRLTTLPCWRFISSKLYSMAPSTGIQRYVAWADTLYRERRGAKHHHHSGGSTRRPVPAAPGSQLKTACNPAWNQCSRTWYDAPSFSVLDSRSAPARGIRKTCYDLYARDADFQGVPELSSAIQAGCSVPFTQQDVTGCHGQRYQNRLVEG